MNQSFQISALHIHFAVAAQYKYQEVWQFVHKLLGEILRRSILYEILILNDKRDSPI
jgi:hypothetical protein|tara:strand:+ start:146 stop:316 length:171 start_codon:yes stop_codon:yes gene_type:complete